MYVWLPMVLGCNESISQFCLSLPNNIYVTPFGKITMPTTQIPTLVWSAQALSFALREAILNRRRAAERARRQQGQQPKQLLGRFVEHTRYVLVLAAPPAFVLACISN